MSFIETSEGFYNLDTIEHVDLGGGEHSCWGTIKFKGQDEPVNIGDGSYYNDGKHMEHLLIMFHGRPDYNFNALRWGLRGK